MKQPLITVVVAAFNYGKYIAETLQSVENQTFTNWECIIVDDGSTDNTKDVVAEFCKKDNRFQYHYQTNRGLPATRNVAIKLAKGDFFQWLDADDILEVEKLEKQLEVFIKNPEIDIVYSGLKYFYDGKPKDLIFSPDFNKPWTLTKSGSTLGLLNFMLVSCVIMPSMPLLKRSVLDKVGNFDETYRYVEDWNFWLRCFLKDLTIKFLDTKNTDILMRLHSSSMTKSRLNMLGGFLKLRNEFNTWEVDESFKKLNNFLKTNDEIEFFLTQKIENQTQVFPQYFSKRVVFFKFIGNISAAFSLKILKIYKSLLKKYFYLKFES
jgi:glycosyltransferase involved in cell wall biosynthesis